VGWRGQIDDAGRGRTFTVVRIQLGAKWAAPGDLPFLDPPATISGEQPDHGDGAEGLVTIARLDVRRRSISVCRCRSPRGDHNRL
jgi:hypothetical protein